MVKPQRFVAWGIRTLYSHLFFCIFVFFFFLSYSLVCSISRLSPFSSSDIFPHLSLCLYLGSVRVPKTLDHWTTKTFATTCEIYIFHLYVVMILFDCLSFPVMKWFCWNVGSQFMVSDSRLFILFLLFCSLCL